MHCLKPERDISFKPISSVVKRLSTFFPPWDMKDGAEINEMTGGFVFFHGFTIQLFAKYTNSSQTSLISACKPMKNIVSSSGVFLSQGMVISLTKLLWNTRILLLFWEKLSPPKYIQKNLEIYEQPKDRFEEWAERFCIALLKMRKGYFR